MNKAIRKVSSNKKSLEIGVNNIAAIEFRQNEKGGTLGAFDIYNAYDELGNILTIEGFFLDDNIQVEYKKDRPERQATLFDFM
ncbi:hypothetical protein [Macrococcus armenti]|uniref:hypothetical protein n=1 Tax=Macrococcus armenti TaxID=2875764 RepID=UPI001CD40169|nr:hypothetical protein [Macrococcus armenti]UBH10624.1 hypothetical protein LAU38_10355 [Macrococcus armenti]